MPVNIDELDPATVARLQKAGKLPPSPPPKAAPVKKASAATKAAPTKKDDGKTTKKETGSGTKKLLTGAGNAVGSVGKKTGTAARKQARRQITNAPGAARTLAKGAVRPVASARTGTIAGLLAGTVGLALLTSFLLNAGKVAGFLGGITRALQWLADPTKIIEFRS